MLKVAVIGAGHVGATTALMLAQRNLGEIVLLDILPGTAEGTALDISESGPVLRFESRVRGTGDYADIAGAQIAIITAGSPRKPGMSRMDLLAVNAAVVAGAARQIARHAPEAILLVVTNPLDVMCHVAWQSSGFSAPRVIGMAGVLDSSRFRHFIAEELHVAVEDTQAMVLGGHGDSMVPLAGYACVSGIPITQLMTPEAITRLIERTRNGGTEIVNLLKTGSASYAAAAGITQIVEAIVLDTRRLLPASVRLEGAYGLHGVFLGVPIILSRQGVERIVEIELTEAERRTLAQSAEDVRHGIRVWEEMMP